MQLVLSLSPGGTERLVIEICKRLSDRVESMVCCLDDQGDWAAELAALKIPVVALGRQPGFHPSLARQVAGIIKANHIDVVHCHHYTPYVYGVLAATLTNTKLVFTEHGRLSGGGPSARRKLVNPILSALPGRIYSVSGDLKQHMVAEGFPARCIEVIYNGIDPARRPTAMHRQIARELLGLRPESLVIGTVGRLDPVKNLPVMLQACAMLRQTHPEAHTVIIGDGPERAGLESSAASLGITDAVTFAGHRDDVRMVMPAFDVYVNCSIYEGVSLTILEAMAATLPVIATPVGGNPEVVIDHETGYLVPGQPRLIADAVARLAADPRRRRTMGDAGRWRVMRHFSLARMVSDYAAAYFRPAASATAPAPIRVPAAADPMSVREATRSTV